MISIIVPVFNQLQYTQQCFDSLLRQTDEGSYELIVIDNGSTDGTGSYLKTLPMQKTIVTNQSNMGVAPAWNQGIRLAKYDPICIVNNDILFPPVWLANFQKAFDAFPEVEAWYPRAIRADKLKWDEIKHRISELALDTVQFSIKFPHERVAGKESDCEDDRGNIGYFQIYRKSVFEKVGLFDEDFLMFCREDIDFFMRLEELQIEKRQLTNVIIFHYEGATLRTIEKSEMDFYIRHNFARFMKKWGGV